MSIWLSIKLLEIFLYFLESSLQKFRISSPIFSTSQGNVKVSPTTALYVCPCEINLGCDVDDVVASDLLPRKKKKKENGKSERGRKNLNLVNR
jgi:hypothetical protein